MRAVMVALKIFPVHARHSASLCTRLQAMKELSCDCALPRSGHVTGKSLDRHPARAPEGAEEAMACTRGKVWPPQEPITSKLTHWLLCCRDAESPFAVG
jgi:hypothetical protein